MTAAKHTTGETWKAHVLDTYTVETAQLPALDVAASALDRVWEAQKLLDRDGLVIDGLHGPKVSPAVAIRRDASAEFQRWSRLLGIYTSDDEA